MDDSKLFRMPLKVMGHHIGPEGWAHPWFVQNAAQDISVAISEAYGFNSNWYKREGTGWVMRRIDIDHQRPWPLELELLGETWISRRTRLTATREYRFRVAKSVEILTTGQAEWVYVDAETRRPTSIPPIFEERYPSLGVSATEPFEWPDASDLSAIAESKHRVMYSDLDGNNHANNTAFIRWISDALRETTEESARLRRWQIHFQSPATPGAELHLALFRRELTEELRCWLVRMTDSARNSSIAKAWVLTDLINNL